MNFTSTPAPPSLQLKLGLVPKAFACLVVLIEGKFCSILSLKIFSSISFVLLQQIQQNITLWLSVV